MSFYSNHRPEDIWEPHDGERWTLADDAEDARQEYERWDDDREAEREDGPPADWPDDTEL